MRFGKLTPVAALAFGCVAVESPPETDRAGSGFLARAQRHIAAREYWASATADGLQAPNRQHDLRTWFDPAGVRVHARTASGSPRLVGLNLAGVGRGDALAPVGPGEVSHHESRVEIRRDGLVEWYENSALGLEQGFTLAERPAAAGDGELMLELSVAGARANRRGDAVALATDAGRKLAYGKLAVTDATGRALAARFEVPAPDRIRIAVNDAGSTYPIVVDPLLEGSADTIVQADQGSAFFGVSVASAGDVNGDGFADVIVGATHYDSGQTDEGAAFVFMGSASGVSDATPATAHAQLEGDQDGAQMGNSVASAGDVNGDGYADVIVGAPYYDAGQTDEGAAFVFTGSATGVSDGNPATAHAQIESDQPAGVLDLAPALGHSVASAGDVNGDGYDDVIVGAPYYNAGQVDEGAAFVFTGSAIGVADGNPATAHAQIESDQTAGVFFDSAPALGHAVASAGDVNGDGYADVIVGAPYYNAGQIDEGAAFVFMGSASGVADGNPATAHAQLESDQGGTVANLAPRLGHGVASAGDVNGDGYADVIVGAPYFDAGQQDEGAAFVFTGSAAGIADGSPATAHAQLESNQTGNIFLEAPPAFGYSVASAGDVDADGYPDVIIGAPFYDATLTDEGAAFVFTGTATGIADGNPTTSYAPLLGGQAGAGDGYSVASAGDVNGDGFADVIVGAYTYDLGQPDEGIAVVVHGGAAGIESGGPSTADTFLQGNLVNASFGVSVAAADVNGDGYADVIAGAHRYDTGAGEAGAVFVFHGSATGIPNGSANLADTQLLSTQVGARFGQSVGAAGDVNADGFADVIVGAEVFDSLQTDEGGAFVYHGSASGIPSGTQATANTQLECDQVAAFCGHDVASAGDVNGDGYADVIIGAPFYDGAAGDRTGAAFVFLGGFNGVPYGTPFSAHARLEGTQIAGFLNGEAFGSSVASAGDVNGDGYSDVIVGASSYDFYYPGPDGLNGAAFVFHGSASGIAHATSLDADTLLLGDQFWGFMGHCVASAGDVNGDGYADVLVSAPGYDAPEEDEGVVFVHLGSPTGVGHGGPWTAHAQLESDQVDALLGYWPETIASAGDVNGDGYGDVIAGAIGFDAGQAAEGAAFVFLGSAAGIADGNPTTAHATLEGNQAEPDPIEDVPPHLGNAVAAGDVNGDGYSDVIVGASGLDLDQIDEGAVLVFHGNSDGRPVLARQRSVEAPFGVVQPWGAAGHLTSFRVELRGTHPAGVGRVRAEVEACPTGVEFGDAACTSELSPAWVLLASGNEEALLTTDLTGLDPFTLYRWRARVLHASATGPLPANPFHTPWRRLGAQSIEADIRTLPEPATLAALASGIALISALRRRRMHRA